MIFDEKYLIIFLVAFVGTYLATYIIIRISFSRGLVGRDVHKNWISYASSIGGSSLLVGSVTPLIISTRPEAIVVALSSLIALIIGLIDDLKRLPAIPKVLLSILPGAPVIILGSYNPHPYIPFVGEARLIISYPLIILIGYAVALNAVNMSDTHNGLAAGVALIFLSSILPITEGINRVIILSMIASIASFLIYNTYPAKTFLGNSGSFVLGSWIASVAFINHIEYLVILSLFPLVINGYSIITSVKGLKERGEIKIRPVRVVNGFIHGNKDPRAPVTLANVASQKRPIRETEFVISVYILILLSSIISIVLFYKPL